MNLFESFRSNTLAATCNQNWFAPEDAGAVQTGRVFYRVFSGGSYSYRFFFSNLIDSTYSDGSHSHANLICGGWELCGARCGVCGECADFAEAEIRDWTELSFGGLKAQEVHPAEFFVSDSVPFSAAKGEYLCLEIRFRGERIPYLEEAVIPIYRRCENRWVPDHRTPLAYLAGCSRPVKGTVAFLGDSITMGIGTPSNSYRNWAALIAEDSGDAFAWWNLGIGFGRAADAATDSAWLFKAKQADLVSVCFGVNDIQQEISAEGVEHSLKTILTKLKEAGCRVGFFTIPPFSFAGSRESEWREINRYIREDLSRDADYVFDVVPILGQEAPQDHLARYGGHPNEEGCRALADAFCAFARERGLFR